jgi:hypothetical protein
MDSALAGIFPILSQKAYLSKSNAIYPSKKQNLQVQILSYLSYSSLLYQSLCGKARSHPR